MIEKVKPASAQQIKERFNPWLEMVCWALIDIQPANYRDSPKWEYYAIERCTRKSAIKHLTLNTTWNMLINAFILTSVECTEMHFKQPAKKFLLHA